MARRVIIRVTREPRMAYWPPEIKRDVLGYNQSARPRLSP